MNNIEKIELLEHIAIAYKDDETINNEFVSPQGRFIKNKELAQAIENLIQENKELRIQISARETVVDELEKENKELKKQMGKDLDVVYIKGVYDERDKWKNKIKANIEKLQEDIKYSANPLSIDNSKFGIKVLQSLLEKE